MNERRRSSDHYYHPDDLHRLFVYGTMLAGYRNHDRLSRVGARFLGKVVTRPKFSLVTKVTHSGQIAPVAVPGGERAIAGELYQINGSALAKIDVAEGHPRTYRRHRIMLPGDIGCAWMYLYHDMKTLPGGEHVWVDAAGVLHYRQ